MILLCSFCAWYIDNHQIAVKKCAISLAPKTAFFGVMAMVGNEGKEGDIHINNYIYKINIKYMGAHA